MQRLGLCSFLFRSLPSQEHLERGLPHTGFLHLTTDAYRSEIHTVPFTLHLPRPTDALYPMAVLNPQEPAVQGTATTVWQMGKLRHREVLLCQ
jgi:hypothetical protein